MDRSCQYLEDGKMPSNSYITISTHEKGKGRKRVGKSTDLEIPFANINKASLLHSLPLKPLVNNHKSPSHHPTSLLKKSAPLRNGRLVSHGPIISNHMRRPFHTLHPTSRFRCGISLFEECCPICNRADQIAQVDIVKGGRRKRPGRGAIFNLESEVGWDPCGLDGGDVCAGDFGFWVLVGEIDSPNAATCTDVKYSLSRCQQERKTLASAI